jgi:hypothetical protein
MTATAILNEIADRAALLPDRDAAHRVSRTLRALAVQASGTPGLPSDTGTKLAALADYEEIRWFSGAVALWREAAAALG